MRPTKPCGHVISLACNKRSMSNVLAFFIVQFVLVQSRCMEIYKINSSLLRAHSASAKIFFEGVGGFRRPATKEKI